MVIYHVTPIYSKDRSFNRKIKSLEEQREPPSLEISFDQENFISTMICAAELKGPGEGRKGALEVLVVGHYNFLESVGN